MIGAEIEVNWKTVGAFTAAAALLIWWQKRQLAAAARVAKENAYLVNPVDDRNAANQAVTEIGKAVTGQDDWTLGGAIYDMGHDENNRANWFGRALDSVILN